MPEGDAREGVHDARPPEHAAPDLPPAVPPRRRLLRALPVLLTLAATALAAWLGWSMWGTYMEDPWTRDGTVRAYVVTVAPEVEGRIVELPVVDNQLVRQGDPLMTIDPTNYRIAVALAQASVQQAQANSDNMAREARRRQELTNLAVSAEQQQSYLAAAQVAQAQLLQAQANLQQAQVNLERTQIRSPVNGWVTNLATRLGDYATTGQARIFVVDADSFWVDGYFIETVVHALREGDPATIRLMGYAPVLRGHVVSIARGINVANAQPNQQGLAVVNPVFTWVRLAQRIPVRVHIDQVPDGVRLVAGMTATVQVEPQRSLPGGAAPERPAR